MALELVAGAAGLDRAITSPYIQKTGLALAGLSRVPAARPGAHLRRQRGALPAEPGAGGAARRARRGRSPAGIPCVLATSDLPLPPEVADRGRPRRRAAAAHQRLDAAGHRQADVAILEDRLASREVVHGVLMDVLGLGVLLVGESGIGKSECALDLISRGHRLVADDAVEVRRRAETVIIGTCAGPDPLLHGDPRPRA